MLKTGILVVIGVLALTTIGLSIRAYRSAGAVERPAVDVHDPKADPVARERAILSMGRSGPEAKGDLRKLLAAPEPGVRAAAVTALADQKDWESMPRFLDLLTDDDVVVRSRANQAVVKLTGWEYRFDPAAPPAARAPVVARMRREYQAIGRETPAALRN